MCRSLFLIVVLFATVMCMRRQHRHIISHTNSFSNVHVSPRNLHNSGEYYTPKNIFRGRTAYICCPKSTHIHTIHNYGCNKREIKPCECVNGGVCSGPAQTCICRTGWQGPQCHIDIDECEINKPCDQICSNTPGSYECSCREEFNLRLDKHSCEYADGEEPALEAKDLEYEILDKRVIHLEKVVGNTKQFGDSFLSVNQFKSQMDLFAKQINYLKLKLESINSLQTSIEDIKIRLKYLEG